MEFLRSVVDKDFSDAKKVMTYSALDLQVVDLPVYRKYIKEADLKPPKTVLVNFRLHLFSKLPTSFKPGIRNIRSTSGLWNITEPIIAHQTSDKDDSDNWFQASVRIPQKSEFEWRWTMYDVDEDEGFEVVDVEKDARRCQIGRFGGILHTSWDSEVKILEPEMCVVTFITKYQALSCERVALIGSSEVLGEWKACQAIPAHEYPTGSCEWMATVPIEKHVDQEWKWIIMDKYSDCIRRWEDRPNRDMNGDHCDWKNIWAPWNGPDFVTDYGFWMPMDLASLRIPRCFDTLSD